MAWDVEYTDEFGAWFGALDERTQDAVDVSVGLLMAQGPALGFPHSSGIHGSRHGHLRELRVQARGQPLRVFYAFDPRRSAILLVAATKKSESDKAFYARYVPLADDLYDTYLDELKREGLL